MRRRRMPGWPAAALAALALLLVDSTPIASAGTPETPSPDAPSDLSPILPMRPPASRSMAAPDDDAPDRVVRTADGRYEYTWPVVSDAFLADAPLKEIGAYLSRVESERPMALQRARWRDNPPKPGSRGRHCVSLGMWIANPASLTPAQWGALSERTARALQTDTGPAFAEACVMAYRIEQACRLSQQDTIKHGDLDAHVELEALTDALVSRLANTDPADVSSAGDSIQAFGRAIMPSHLPALTAHALETPDDLLCWRLVSTLAGAGFHRPGYAQHAVGVIDAMQEIVLRPAPTTNAEIARRMAITVIGQASDEPERAARALAHLAESADRELREGVVRAMASLCTPDRNPTPEGRVRAATAAFPLYEEALGTVGHTAVLGAPDVCEHLGAGAEPLIDELVALLEPGDPVSCAHAARALGHVGAPARRAVPVLLRLSADSSEPAVRDAAVFAIARVGGSAPPRIP